MKSIQRLIILFAIIFSINAMKTMGKKTETNTNTESLTCINNLA